MFRKVVVFAFARRLPTVKLPVHRNLAALSSSTSNSRGASLLGTASFSSKALSVGIVDYQEVKSLPSQSNIVLIDVREPKEIQETGKIPTSINIPLGIIADELGPGVVAYKFAEKYGCAKPDESTNLIFYCKIGRRSLMAAEAALTLGYKNVKNYQGSWTDWAEKEGLPQ